MSIQRSWRSLWRARKYQALVEEIRLVRVELEAKKAEYDQSIKRAYHLHQIAEAKLADQWERLITEGERRSADRLAKAFESERHAIRDAFNAKEET